MPDNFTRHWKASGWESVNWTYLPILFLNLSSPTPAQTSPLLLDECQDEALGALGECQDEALIILSHPKISSMEIFGWERIISVCKHYQLDFNKTLININSQ